MELCHWGHCTGHIYLDFIFETSIRYWQNQPGSPLLQVSMVCNLGTVWETLFKDANWSGHNRDCSKDLCPFIICTILYFGVAASGSIRVWCGRHTASSVSLNVLFLNTPKSKYFKHEISICTFNLVSCLFKKVHILLFNYILTINSTCSR